MPEQRRSAGRSTHGSPSRPPEGRVQIARRVACEVIVAVRESGAYANLLLPVKLERAKLSGADAALATELCYGTLRMAGYYDAVIALAADRTVSAIDPAVLDVLRLGAHQLLSMRVATHAAVDESVSLARLYGSRSATGFVNAVLRTITRSSAEQWRIRVLDDCASADERLSLEYAHPVWIVRAFRQALVAEGRGDELLELLAADNVPPRVSLVALPGLSSSDDLGDAVPDQYSPFGATSVGGDPTHIEAVREGRARVQDVGSQLAAQALTAVGTVQPGERWLDMCAGPGGKAALVAALAREGGASMVANEVVPARTALVESALAPIGGDVTVQTGDGRDFGAAEPDSFDRILVDAPCTGLGALRRRPEARWRKVPRDVPALSALQLELLESAVAALRPGGVLAYVTCSPHLAETRMVVTSLLKRHPEISRLDTGGVLAGVTKLPLDLGDSDGSVQLWPHRHGTDAMFICLMQRDG